MKPLFFYLIIFLVVFSLEVHGDATLAVYDLDHKKIKFHEKKLNCDITGAYPQFKSSRIPADDLQKINARIKKFSRSLFMRFLSGDDIGKQVKEELRTDPNWNSFDFSFKIVRADTKYVSVLFDPYYLTRGSHGVQYFYAFNYDVKHSRIIQLRDLFKPGINYLKQINYFSNLGLKKQLGTGFSARNAVTDKDQFTFDKESITIQFDDYEVASYSEGAPSINAPFKSLTGLKEIMDIKNE